MKLALRLALGATVALVLGGAYYVFLVPKIGHAPRSEVEAVLPPSLKRVDPPDPEARERFDRLVDLARAFRNPSPSRSPFPRPGPVEPPPFTASDRAVLEKIDAILASGPIRSPGGERADTFLSFSACRDVARKLASAAEDARRRGDREACLRWTLVGLRFADAVRRSGGAVIDALVASAVNAIATRAAYVTEIEGAFDAAARRRIIQLVPPEDGSSPEMAECVRRDFRLYLLPVILDPRQNVKNLLPSRDFRDLEDDASGPVPLAGTFDPVETARVTGRLYNGLMADLRRPFWQAKYPEAPILARLGEGLPRLPAGGHSDFLYRCAMNAGHNTLGRYAATNTVLTQLGVSGARNAAYRNLLRAAILLRMGRPPDVIDPYDGKPIRVDRRRKIVWCVSGDGKDDGGNIEEGGRPTAPDLGFPYGDHCFRPNRGPRVPARPGMPPPIGTRP